ncbi:hypothetical protein BC629DRAFT_1561060 [Irpex lacteus]|nr:hypothetical protein BC629DRAFT_1561060 [Irpex lacteus]
MFNSPIVGPSSSSFTPSPRLGKLSTNSPPVDLATVKPYPEIPPELVLYILTCACHTSHETALNVSLVSSWVRSTVLPYVFSTIVRRAGTGMNAFRSRTRTSRFPLGFRFLGNTSQESGLIVPLLAHNPAVPTAEDLPPPIIQMPPTAPGQRPNWVYAPVPFNNKDTHKPQFSHLLPPTTRDLGQYVRHLWVESIDMMSSPGELNIFDACTGIEDVALAAGSLRVLYNLTKQGGQGGQGPSTGGAGGPPTTEDAANEDTQTPPSTVGAASRIRSVLLTKHTFRYDWHFLVAIDSVSDTHTTVYPLEYLPNLTHLALPYLQLRANQGGDALRIPELVLQPDRPTVVGGVGRQQGQWGEAPWAAARDTTSSKLKMIVLTIDERVWLTEPWKYGAHATNDSPRQLFKKLRTQARARDARIRVVLSPRLGQTYCSEWADAGRGIAGSVWEVAEKTYDREDYGDDLPEAFPRLAA